MFVSQKKYIIILVALFLFVFTGCGKEKNNHKENYGKIKKVSVKENKKEKEGKFLFEDAKDFRFNKKYAKTKMFHDGFAHVSYPVPTDWIVETESANHIVMKHRQYDSYIFIEHSIIDKNEYAKNYSISAADLITLFDSKLEIQEFQIDDMTLTRDVHTNLIPADLPFAKGKDNLKVVCSDYTPLEVESTDIADDESEISAAERRYYIQHNGVCTCISMISDYSNFSGAIPVVNGIVAGMRVYDESFDEITKVNVADGFKLNLPSQFVGRNTAEKEQDNGTYDIHQVSAAKNNSYAGSFVVVQDLKSKSYDFTKETKNGNMIFRQAFPEEYEHTDNRYQTNPLSSDNLSLIRLWVKKASDAGYKTSPVYYTTATITRTSIGGSKLIENGNTFIYEQFTAGKDGNTYLVTFGYPLYAETAAKKIAEIAAS